MNSPIGPVFGDSIESNVQSGLKQLPVYPQYHDETFVISDGEEQAQHLLILLNNKHPNVTHDEIKTITH